MAQARGRATVAAATVLLLVVVQCGVSSAATFKVGDEGGWVFGVQDWPNGKTFKDGDILEFNYTPGRHNVVVVDEKGYNECKAASGATTFTTGKDQITLKKGKSFFLCGFPTHCDNGMKLAITVA
ncbi:basic blue protein-like [Melia azedarach]|uniref:Basic blue protein-like n=1 Tax=Melia azedarach TaxID=155640 RepID=A0ACC1Y1H1_MELAZ|nr:basic blue protein-like [Melia azedarach]